MAGEGQGAPLHHVAERQPSRPQVGIPPLAGVAGGGRLKSDAQVAEWAGHGVDVLLRIYAKCVVGQDELARRRISKALRQD